MDIITPSFSYASANASVVSVNVGIETSSIPAHTSFSNSAIFVRSAASCRVPSTAIGPSATLAGYVPGIFFSPGKLSSP